MKKLLLTVAMLVAFTVGGPALAFHGQSDPFVEGRQTMARTLYCIGEANARLVAEYWVAGGDSAAMTLIRTLAIPADIPGITRCGVGEGSVTPIELVDQYTRGDEITNLIRVFASGIEIEIILITKIPFALSGDPI